MPLESPMDPPLLEPRNVTGLTLGSWLYLEPGRPSQ